MFLVECVQKEMEESLKTPAEPEEPEEENLPEEQKQPEHPEHVKQPEPSERSVHPEKSEEDLPEESFASKVIETTKKFVFYYWPILPREKCSRWLIDSATL